jgi:hypothetical protein
MKGAPYRTGNAQTASSFILLLVYFSELYPSRSQIAFLCRGMKRNL